MNEIQFAKDMIESIKETRERSEACGMFQEAAESSREIVFWETRIRRLQAA